MQGNNYTYFGIGCRMALFIVYPDRAHLGCIITPNLSVTSLHGMAKNGKNQQGKRIKQHIGRNLPQYAAIRRITSIRPYPIIFQQDLARRYFPIKRNKSFRFLYQYSGISGNALLPARKSQFLCSGSLYGNIIHINPHQMSKYQLHFRNPRFNLGRSAQIVASTLPTLYPFAAIRSTVSANKILLSIFLNSPAVSGK